MNHRVNNFPPNINPQLFTWIACLVGSACADSYTPAEQNSFGNWLILVGQFILTAAAQEQLINNRRNTAKNQTFGDGIFGDNGFFQSGKNSDEINFLIDAVNRLQQEINNLKR